MIGKEESQKWLNVLNSALVPIIICRLSDAKILFVNNKASHYFGRSGAKVLGENYIFFCDSPVVQSKVLGRVLRAGFVEAREIKIRIGSLAPFWVLMSIARIEFLGHQSILISFSDISEQKKYERNLIEQVHTDPLTGIYNRRWFDEMADKELERARRYKSSLSGAVIDIDKFKYINDSYGHIAGDTILRKIVDITKKRLRKADTLARVGGEEFAIIFPHTSLKEGIKVAERIRRAIESSEFIYENEKIKVTVSIGVSELIPEDGISYLSLYQRIDEAMYKAKTGGRNQVAFLER